MTRLCLSESPKDHNGGKSNYKLLDILVSAYFIIGLLAFVEIVSFCTRTLIQNSILISIPILVAFVLSPLCYRFLNTIEKSAPLPEKGSSTALFVNYARKHLDDRFNIFLFVGHFILHTFSSGTLLLLALLYLNISFLQGESVIKKGVVTEVRQAGVVSYVDDYQVLIHGDNGLAVGDSVNLVCRKGLLGFYVSEGIEN